MGSRNGTMLAPVSLSESMPWQFLNSEFVRVHIRKKIRSSAHLCVCVCEGIGTVYVRANAKSKADVTFNIRRLQTQFWIRTSHAGVCDQILLHNWCLHMFWVIPASHNVCDISVLNYLLKYLSNVQYTSESHSKWYRTFLCVNTIESTLSQQSFTFNCILIIFKRTIFQQKIH